MSVRVAAPLVAASAAGCVMQCAAGHHAAAVAGDAPAPPPPRAAAVVVCALYKFTRLPQFEALKPPLLATMEQVRTATLLPSPRRLTPARSCGRFARVV